MSRRTTAASAAGLAGMALIVVGGAAPRLAARQGAAAGEAEPAGAPALYDALREATLEPAGRIRDGRLALDRFDLDLTDGDLFLLEPIGGLVTGAVFLGRGTIRGYPPDAVEHQQLKKLIDEDSLDEDFDRLVLRFTDDTADRLRALADPSDTRGDLDKATDVFDDRRNDAFKDQLVNADSRILIDLVERRDAPGNGAGPIRPYELAFVHGRKHDWFAIEVEPRNLEEVLVSRYDKGFEMTDVWMGFHALTDFDAARRQSLRAPFPVDPDSLDKKPDEITGVDLGLPKRPLVPPAGYWTPRVDLPLVTADVALNDDGKTNGTAALLVEPLVAAGTLRLRISPFLEVTDVRWRPADPEGAGASDLLAGRPGTDDPSDPVPVAGDPLAFVQERRSRFMADDLFEPWVTIVLPRRVEAGERFVVELAYEGKVVEKLQSTLDYVLRDTLYWIPKHPDARRTRFHLTFRVPKRYGVVSSGELVDDHVEEGTRIIRRMTRTPMRQVSFHFARFDVTEVDLDGLPPITVFANADSTGFAPGQREKTIDDLAGAIRTQAAYFGAYPFSTLQVTETATLNGQAFAGFLLLSYQSFGELHQGEAELFRSHEVAHQWWGAGVDWLSYRDQWISEGFAQYGAALYTLTGLGETDAFADMLEAWRRDILGDVTLRRGRGRAQYGMIPAVIRKSDGSRSGALVTGVRLQSTKTPYDYRLVVYEKGAFILHMLRMMLMQYGPAGASAPGRPAVPETRPPDVASTGSEGGGEGNDGRFRELMRTFAARYMHRVTDTADFEAVVSEVFGEPMDWFFDQWVYGVDVPTYRPDLEVSPPADGDAPFVLHGTITQEDVPDDFRMPVPIRLGFPDGRSLVARVWVDRPTVEVQIPLPARPNDIEFNCGEAVLARVKK